MKAEEARRNGTCKLRKLHLIRQNQSVHALLSFLPFYDLPYSTLLTDDKFVSISLCGSHPCSYVPLSPLPVPHFHLEIILSNILHTHTHTHEHVHTAERASQRGSSVGGQVPGVNRATYTFPKTDFRNTENKPGRPAKSKYTARTLYPTEFNSTDSDI